MARIEHFALFASDLAALKDFYVEVFSMRVLIDNSAADPAGYFLGDGHGGVLELIARPSGEPAFNQRFGSHVAFSVEDVAAARAALERKGLVFESDTAVNKPTMQTAFFLDPQGNRCQVVWRKEPF